MIPRPGGGLERAEVEAAPVDAEGSVAAAGALSTLLDP